MAIIDPEQEIVARLLQLTPQQRIRVLNHFAVANPDALATEEAGKPRPIFGSGKDDIAFIAEDFDAPLEEMLEYMR